MKPIHPHFERNGRRVAMLVYFACIAMGLGCSQPPQDKPTEVNLGYESRALDSHADAIHQNSDRSDDAAKKAETKAPAIKPEMATVREANADNRTHAEALKLLSDQLEMKQVQIDKLRGDVVEANTLAAKQEKRAIKAESAAAQWEWRVLSGIKIASGLAVAVSLTLVCLGMLRTAIPTVIAAGVFVGSVVVQVAIEYQLAIGAGCGLLIVGVIAYEFWIKRQTLKQVVTTVDESMRSLDGKLPEKMVEIAGYVQSKTTAKLIDAAQGNGPINKLRRWLGGFIAGQPVAVKV